jgi:hypothetical protein
VNATLMELYAAGLIELDPEYEQQARAMLESMQDEARAYSSPLESSTMIGGSLARAPLPASASSATQKRDLRDLANLGAPDPVPSPTKPATATTLSLSLEPVDGGDGYAVASVSGNTLAELKRFATHYLFDALGNSGTALCFAIDGADSFDRFKEVVTIAKNTLRDMKSANIAAEFQKQIDDIVST